MKRVLVIGVSGQDGTLLTNFFKKEGIDFRGINRSGLMAQSGEILCFGTLADPQFITEEVASFSPTHVFYLAAHHHSSQQSPDNSDAALWRSSMEVQVLGLAHTLHAIQREAPNARLLYASSSHIYGSPTESRQNEMTPLAPRNVYGVTKAAGMDVCRYYRDRHGLFVSVAILYNHESVYRKEIFLSKKVIQAVRAVKEGRSERLVLGDLSSEVDWGYAPDYVDAMIRILDLERPDTYIVATGITHSAREFVQIAFQQQGLDYRDWVEESPSLTPSSQGRLVGDASKLRHETGWSPTVSFPEMIRLIATQVAASTRKMHE